MGTSNRLNTDLAVGRHRHQRPLRHQQLFGHLLVDQVVFHHQNSQAGQPAFAGLASLGFAQIEIVGNAPQCGFLQHGRGHGFDKKGIQQGLLLQSALR